MVGRSHKTGRGMMKEMVISVDGKCLGFEETQQRGSRLREGLSGRVWSRRPIEGYSSPV